jgi:hypothetical protein
MDGDGIIPEDGIGMEWKLRGWPSPTYPFLSQFHPLFIPFLSGNFSHKIKKMFFSSF